MDNECPICYESKVNCHLICGHLFCKRCITLWYCKNASIGLCPLCRKQIIFKGICNFKKYIVLHKKCNIIQNVFEKYLELILNKINLFSMIYLKYICSQLNTLMTYKRIFSEDEIDIILYFNFPAYKELNLYEHVEKKSFIHNHHSKRKFDTFKNMFYIRYK